MEYWNIGMMGEKIKSLNPLFHHSMIPIFQCFSDSIIPVFQYSNFPMGFPGKKKGAPGAPFGQA